MVAYIIHWVFKIYFILLVARIIGSWVPQFQHTKLMRFVGFYTDPYLNLFRRIIPPIGGMDFSPIIAFIVLQGVQTLILGLLSTL
ncbi:MAG: YggT family protein [Chlamydiia bacterium]|nr:YggT family protein [Chlamydiia bacterium]MCP5509429.1 YggT family protein [Chlamydiales bacterium]